MHKFTFRSLTILALTASHVVLAQLHDCNEQRCDEVELGSCGGDYCDNFIIDSYAYEEQRQDVNYKELAGNLHGTCRYCKAIHTNIDKSWETKLDLDQMLGVNDQNQLYWRLG